MNKSDIISNMRKVFVSVLDHENFEMKEELSAKDVDGWDSLSHILIITGIEKHFQVRFKLRELNSLDNLGNLIDLVQSKLG